MKLTVLGAGAWGTALAHCAAARHDVLLWARDPVQAGLLQRDRRNARYLPGVDLDMVQLRGRPGVHEPHELRMV